MSKKSLPLFGFLFLSLICGRVAPAQTTPLSNTAGMIVTTSGSWSLSADEVATMSYMMWRSKMVESDPQKANDLINAASNAIATAHGVDPSSPFQIVMDISWTLSFTPAWTTIAGEGDTVTVKAGT